MGKSSKPNTFTCLTDRDLTNRSYRMDTMWDYTPTFQEEFFEKILSDFDRIEAIFLKSQFDYAYFATSFSYFLVMTDVIYFISCPYNKMVCLTVPKGRILKVLLREGPVSSFLAFDVSSEDEEMIVTFDIFGRLNSQDEYYDMISYCENSPYQKTDLKIEYQKKIDIVHNDTRLFKGLYSKQKWISLLKQEQPDWFQLSTNERIMKKRTSDL